MDWYPGAFRVPQGGNGNAITARPAENVLHIAASNWNIDLDDPTNPGKGIAGWNGTARACNGYNDQRGAMQQYCSVWNAVNGTKDGNWRCRTWESWNPEGNGSNGGDYDSSTWTPEQCERWSDLLAWDHNENGALLQDMRDSRRSSHGCGVHRYGITGYAPWRDVGGEVWSTSSSKVCPGTARVQQLPGIIARAQVIADAVKAGKCNYLPPGQVDLKSALARTSGETVIQPSIPSEEETMIVRRDLQTDIDYAYDSRNFILIKDPAHYGLLLSTGFIDVEHGAAKRINTWDIEWIRGQIEAWGGRVDAYIKPGK